MGAYLSKPVTDKVSKDCESNGLMFGASEMQGWRVSMEDAWNGLLDFDESTSMFAVYDGHGGQDVAQYCAKRLPDFIKRAESYKNGDLKKALDEAFRDIDQSILTEEVIEELKELAGDEADDDDTNEAALLSEEATIPIEELLKKMKQEANAIEFEKLIMNGANNKDSEDDDSDAETAEHATDKHINGDSDAQETHNDNEKDQNESKTENEEDAADSNKSTDADENIQEGVDNVEEDKEADDGDEDIENEDDADDEDSDEENEDSAEEDEFGDADEVCMPQSDEVGKDSGATAIVALLNNDQLYVANVGDSRCVLCRGKKAVDLSKDHKPEDDSEKERISKAGGRITQDGRVNGGLNLSRAIGDHNYKTNENLQPHEQVISAVPDIEETTITKDDRFMILACDGIWNVMTSQEAVDFVSEKLDGQEKEGQISLSKICEQIFDHCLAPDTSGDGSGCDNMTCIIVSFSNCQIGRNGRRKRTVDNAGDQPSENPEKKQKCD